MGRSVIIYGDGSCLGNPGPGGWAIHVIEGLNRLDKSGRSADSTNNRMELMAALNALKWVSENLDHGDRAEIRMDSQYALKTMFEWLPAWKKRGWRKSSGDPILNVEIIKDVSSALDHLRAKNIILTHRWVKGHDGEPGNERVDSEARRQAESFAKEPDRKEIHLPDHPEVPRDDASPLALIRIRSGSGNGVWDGVQMVARQLTSGMWQAALPVQTPVFSPDVVEDVIELPAAQPCGDIGEVDPDV